MCVLNKLSLLSPFDRDPFEEEIEGERERERERDSFTKLVESCLYSGDITVYLILKVTDGRGAMNLTMWRPFSESSIV